MRRRPRELGKRIKEDWSWDRRPTKRSAGRKQRRVRGSRGGEYPDRKEAGDQSVRKRRVWRRERKEERIGKGVS